MILSPAHLIKGGFVSTLADIKNFTDRSPEMLEIIAALSLLGALVILVCLSVIDLKIGLLPNEYVLGLAILGAVFHLCTLNAYLSIADMALGGFTGAIILYLIRTLAIYFYKEDALGLGDVKLLGAAGIWLGPYYILIAMTLGATAGIIHGLALALYNWKKTKQKINFSAFSLPAGPGFAVGIAAAGVIKFSEFAGTVLP